MSLKRVGKSHSVRPYSDFYNSTKISPTIKEGEAVEQLIKLFKEWGFGNIEVKVVANFVGYVGSNPSFGDVYEYSYREVDENEDS